MKRITKLTDEQKSALIPHADEWIRRGLDTTPVDHEEWESGARKCYAYAGIPWPGRVVWVPSPLVGALAAPTAAYLIAYRSGGAVDGAVSGAVRGAVSGAVHGAVNRVVGDAVHGTVNRVVGDAVHGTVRNAVNGAVRGAVHGAVGDAVDGAVHGAVSSAVRNAVSDAVSSAVSSAVDSAVNGAVDSAVNGAVDSAVNGAVDSAVNGAVRRAVSDAVDGAVHGAVSSAVHGAVSSAVGDAVRRAVDGAVDDIISKLWYYRLGGQWWSYWQAYTSYFRDCTNLELDDDIWQRSYAYEKASTAGWWWPFKDFVMVSERPIEVHLEEIGPRGFGSHRLHCETGPAISWSDGYALYFWHGVRVPEWVIVSPSVELINGEKNSEVRRAGIESLGWPIYIMDVGLKLIHSEADPGNYPNQLELYDVPEQLFDEPIRVLLMTNGSPDRSGSQRQYAETVPDSINTAAEAAAWQYRVPVEIYRQLVRRT